MEEPGSPLQSLLADLFPNAPRRPPPRRRLNLNDSGFVNDLPISPIQIIFDSDVSDDSGVIVISSDEFEEDPSDDVVVVDDDEEEEEEDVDRFPPSPSPPTPKRQRLL